MSHDVVGRAIAAAAHPVQQRFRGQIVLGQGRVALVDLPADITDEELLVLVSALARDARQQIASHREPSPLARLVVPT